MTAITSVQVTASLAGRSRTYRAAFLWGAAKELKMTAYDFITGAVPIDDLAHAVDRELAAGLPAR